jgi:hypothetical protein
MMHLTVCLPADNIESGATLIGSAGRAPNEDGNIGFTIGVNFRLHKRQIINLIIHSHREGFATS